MPVHLPPLFCQFSAPGLFTEFFSDYLRWVPATSEWRWRSWRDVNARHTASGAEVWWRRLLMLVFVRCCAVLAANVNLSYCISVWNSMPLYDCCAIPSALRQQYALYLAWRRTAERFYGCCGIRHLCWILWRLLFWNVRAYTVQLLVPEVLFIVLLMGKKMPEEDYIFIWIHKVIFCKCS
jgi:hypothetical protein